MPLVRLSLERPVAVLAMVLMVLLAGWLALRTIPIQLTPDLRKPQVNVVTAWRGASPAEVEREILNRQEEALKGIEGLETMTGRASQGSARITLEFAIGQNMDRALLLVNNRLSQVTGLPAEADRPELRTRDSDDRPIAWFVLSTRPDNPRDIYTYGDFIDDVVRDRMERVQGVALVNVWGGNARELQVVVVPERAARYGLTVAEIGDALRGTDINATAGAVDEGKRRYVVRAESALTTPERVREVSLRTSVDPATGAVARVTVGDVAEVGFGYKRPTARMRHLGQEAVILGVVRDTGTNVIEVMRGLQAVAEALQEGPLRQAGLDLRQTYDETEYIQSAIALVTQNIWVGGTLAAGILLVFLRSFGATLVIALAIPISVIGSFVAMAALGRSINVISLAGLAFAVGMVVDAAIVVLDNIFRLRESGRPGFEAALRGASQVWGAIAVSALTTVAVFVPILLMREGVGQLFRDIAVALSVAVLLSLVISITVTPSLAYRLIGDAAPLGRRRGLPVIDRLAALFVAGVAAFAAAVVRTRALAAAVILLICGVTGYGTWALLPELDYLPQGNRNLVLAYSNPPPGYNLDTTAAMASAIETALRPHWASSADGVAAVPQKPAIDRFWYIARPGTITLAASAADATRAGELVPLLRSLAFREPGTLGYVGQVSLFGGGIGGSRVIDIDVTGPDLDAVLAAARSVERRIAQVMPPEAGTQVRAFPGLDLGSPELRLTPNLSLLADSGLTARDFVTSIDAFNDGVRVAEISAGGRRIDLVLKGPEDTVARIQGIGDLPVVTRSGQILPVRALADIAVTEGPSWIQHVERERAVTLSVSPADGIPLQAAIDRLKTEVIDTAIAQGTLPGIRLALSGSADEFSRTWNAMKLSLLVALVVVYLVMAILFESLLYPALIMFSVPLATAGGVAGLVVLNLFVVQPLDMLGMLGFIILIGTVVNNAILLVHQTLFLVRDQGLAAEQAIVEATRNRVRPIFMSTLTTVFGMLPLVLYPGAGSELYRGLGAVVVGGLSLSAALTLLLLPPLLSLTVRPIARAGGRGMAAARAG